MVQRFLLTQHIVRLNYRKEEIATAMGLVYMFSISIMYGLGTIAFRYILPIGQNDQVLQQFSFILFSVLLIGLIGWLDDTYGNKEVKGFTGHFGKLFKERELTTGALKALGGGFVALYASFYIEGSLLERILHFFIIALMTNWINLLDLRPGRSVKFFLFIIILLTIFTFSIELYWFIISPVIGMVIALFPGDLKAKFMLGDTGANILGVVAGIIIVLFAPILFKWFVLAFLLVGHAIAEKYSVSLLIERFYLLRMIDKWGRATDN